ncbi:MAG: TIGR04338 family metallohydrolase, partial [Mycobacterium sp.]
MNAEQPAARDWQRSKVYAAEEFVRTRFDRATEHGSGSVEFFGEQLTLPPEARF